MKTKDLAEMIIGEEEISRLKKMASERPLTPQVIRQMFFSKTLKYLSCSPPMELGVIASGGENLCPGENKMDHNIIFHGGGISFCDVYLSDLDSGMVLLQKLAAAAIFSKIIEILTAEARPPEGSDPWMPMEVIGDPSGEAEEVRDLKERMGW